jgi:hypothetical protein
VPWRTGIYNDDSPENVRSTISWVVFFLILGFVIFNVFWANNDVNLALDTIITVFGLHVVWKYARRSILTIVKGDGEAADYLIVGITLSWLGQAGRAAGSIITRLSGFDPVWLNSEFFGWVKLITIIAAVCHVIPAGAIRRDGRESIPAPSRFGVAGAFFISISVIVLLLVYKPNLKPWVDSLPHWSRDMFNTGTLISGREKHADADPPW